MTHEAGSLHNAYRAVGPKLIASGYCAIPIAPDTKAPGDFVGGRWVRMSGWTERFRDALPNGETALWAGAPGSPGVGVVLGRSSRGLVAIDIDAYDEEIVQAIIKTLPSTPLRKRGKKGATLFYSSGGLRSRALDFCAPDGAIVRMIDVLAEGRQTVLPPTIHPDTREPYKWIGEKTLLEVAIDGIPSIVDADIDRAIAAVEAFGHKLRVASHEAEQAAPVNEDTPWARLNAHCMKHLSAWVPKLDLLGCQQYKQGYEAVARWRFPNGGLGLEIEDRNLKIEAKGIVDFGDGTRGYSPITLTIHSGKAANWQDAYAWLAEKTGWVELLSAETADQAVPAPFSEIALAERFSLRHDEEFRHVSQRGKWLRFDGARWGEEFTLLAFDLARKICEEASQECKKPRVASSIASAKTVAAIERLAKADRRHAATEDQWDRDNWLLNTPGGTVDLRTGKLRDHRRRDYMTKSTAVAPGGNCPLWLAFLEKVTANDPGLMAYLQRLIGYALTGETSEHALVFFYGTGGNGKGVFLNTITKILADYAAIASIETFTACNSERHPTDMAMLRGARLVAAQETEEGRRWAESRIKAVTGGDPVTARFMRQDFFTYIPQFKLVIAGNHKPALRSVDEAMRRRMNMVPFTVTIPEAERDPRLPEKLEAEWPGILQWAIDGCLEWQRMGLSLPLAVAAATAEYFEDEDEMGTWINEACIVSPNVSDSSKSLFASWTSWATAAGSFVGNRKDFGSKLEAKGFEKFQNNGRRWRGLKARPTDQEPF